MSVYVDVRRLGELVKSWRHVGSALADPSRSASERARAVELFACSDALEALCVECGAVVVDATGRAVRRS